MSDSGKDPTKDEWIITLSVNRARRLAERGEVEQAYQILMGVTDQKNASTLNNLLAVWKDELLTDLRKRFPDLRIYPQRAGNPTEDLKKYNLRAKEVYILNLFDGVTTIEDALAISPVDEFETLRATSKLIKLGLIQLGQPA